MGVHLLTLNMSRCQGMRSQTSGNYIYDFMWCPDRRKGRQKKKTSGKTSSAQLWIIDYDEEFGLDGEVHINYGRLWWDSVSPAVSASRATLTVLGSIVEDRCWCGARCSKMCAKSLCNIILIINTIIVFKLFPWKQIASEWTVMQEQQHVALL